MTNHEKFRSLTDGIVSPDCYIDFAWYYLNSASLQRRVWCGPLHNPIYPNQYIILCGDPSVGKGLAIRPITKLIKYHRLSHPKEKSLAPSNLSQGDAKAAEIVQEEDLRRAEKDEIHFKSKGMAMEKPLLVPVASDATTYESLVSELAAAYRCKPYAKEDGKVGFYVHSSLCFCLEEIASLFRKKCEDVVHLLIQAWDCGDYNKSTKTQGKDRVKDCCLNILGGTTPGFMQYAFTDHLISEGFSSRAIFVYALKGRERPFWIPELTEEQKVYEKELQEHVLKLTSLYGPVTFAPDADKYLEEWWVEFQKGHERPNINIKLNPYYGRKKVHLLKMSMAIHFGESYEMVVKKSSVEAALKVLAEAEKRMHYALGLDSNDPQSKCAANVCKFIHSNKKECYTYKEIFTEFWSSLPGVRTEDKKEALKSILEYLLLTTQIVMEQKEHPLTKQTDIFYFPKKESDL